MFVRKKRAAPARRGKAGSKRAKAKPKAGLHLPAGLEQRHLDLIGLALVAVGIYLVFVLFAGWEGGKVGYGIETGLVYLFGKVGAKIFTLLMLLAGGMLLTGTSVSTLVRGVARGLHTVFRAIFFSGTEAAQTVARTHADWREKRESAEGETEAAPTDVMSSYPEDDEDFEPTVALAEEDGFDPAIFDLDSEAEAETEVVAEPEPELRNYDPVDAVAVVDPAERSQAGLTPMGTKRGVTTSEEIDYRPPPAKALERGKGDKGPDPRDQEAIGRKLIETLGHFGVEAKIVGVVSGPHVSLFEMRLAPGIKVKKVTELANDLAYALASTDIRILAPIPGKQAVGVEVPNARRRMVRLGDIYAGRPPKTSPLVAWLGKGIDGNAVWTDLAKMPHVLVAGTTGSGKSGCVNAILSSILMQASPNEVRLVLVDPKQVELNHYENVPHLLTPVVTSPRLAANVLSNLIGEMESRYGIM
ncbi:MAG: segregation ATPase FtsK/SpoIIIE, family, partial [Solirubrobacterales bacterium]|nr:segregation ATPase FtsK/SpoIIIE, family [Solirubrobacterales bacterium]